MAAGVQGLLGVALNVAAVVLLQKVPHTYKPHTFALWLSESRAAPTQTVLSAWAFTIGLLALAAFFWALRTAVPQPSSPSLFRSGATTLALGAIMNAAGTLTPIIALEADDGAARAMLHLTLLLDSTFNACLGLGLLQLAFSAGKAWPLLLRALCFVAGAASLPVGLQFMYDEAARFLAIAGPLWLVALTWISLRLLRERPGRD